MTSTSSEDLSSPEGEELELGLELCLCSRGFKGVKQKQGYPRRILTTQNFPYRLLSSSSSSCFSSPSSTGMTTTTSCSSSTTLSSALNRGIGSAGTKRAAPSASSRSEVIGWPPIVAYRMSNMVDQPKSVAIEQYNSMIKKYRSKNAVEEKVTNGSNGINANFKVKTSFFVKVNMDGMPIGRKINLCAQGCYETLAQTVEDMFLRPLVNAKQPSSLVKGIMRDSTRCSKLLDGSSEFVLTYEDKDGDWMLVGDVPWGMFLTSVKRLKIMRKSQAW